VTVTGDTELPDLRLSLPIVHRGVVAVPQQGAESVRVGGALISAYVLRDATGAPVLDPSGLPTCASAPSLATGTATGRCIRSVVQIAETRSTPEGTFELVLPSVLQ
jgi:hypothetical protein